MARQEEKLCDCIIWPYNPCTTHERTDNSRLIDEVEDVYAKTEDFACLEYLAQSHL